MQEKTWNLKKEANLLFLAWSIALLVLFVASIFFALSKPVTVSFLDVEQGDACLIQAGRGGNVLIDGGDDGQGVVLENYFQLQNVGRLDAVFLSHFHEDHGKGILELLQSGFPVGCIYVSEHQSNTELEDDFLQIAKEKKVPVFRLRVDDEITLGKASYKVLGQEAYSGEKALNNMSMVLRMEYEELSFLFTGDLEGAAAERLIDAMGDSLKVDVLKVPHHGGISSVAPRFFSACDPDFAVISVGEDNVYREPADAMLSALMAEDIEIWRTDRDSTIVMTLGRDIIKNISYSKERR